LRQELLSQRLVISDLGTPVLSVLDLDNLLAPRGLDLPASRISDPKQV
jgi:hypothetical protein